MTDHRRVLLAWSSGKDSAWALHRLRMQRDVELVGLLTTVDRGAGEVPIHGVAEALVQAQAQAIGLPLTKVWINSPCSNADYEQAVGAALRDAKDRGVTHVAFGDLFLEDIRRYREDSLRDTGLGLLFPLWGRATGELAREMVTNGLRAVVSAVDTEQLDGTWAGKEFDERFLADLPRQADPCGERGEFHTFVYDGPMFKMPVRLVRGRQQSKGRFRTIELGLA